MQNETSATGAATAIDAPQSRADVDEAPALLTLAEGIPRAAIGARLDLPADNLRPHLYAPSDGGRRCASRHLRSRFAASLHVPEQYMRVGESVRNLLKHCGHSFS